MVADVVAGRSIDVRVVGGFVVGPVVVVDESSDVVADKMSPHPWEKLVRPVRMNQIEMLGNKHLSVRNKLIDQLELG